MIIRNENGVTILRADEGKWLVKGESYSNTDVYLGKFDSVTNWIEQDTEPLPPVEQTPETIIAELEELL